MKKSKKALLTIVLTLLVGIICTCLISCKKKNTVEYVFRTNGAAQISNAVVEEGQEYTLPVPEWPGYSFEGWYLTEDFSGEPVTTVTAAESATYYAKWEKLYLLTLELDSGSLSAPALYLKAGANVYDFLRDYAPTKSGFEFGAWFLGETELSKNTRMPEADLTLTAKYKVGYTVEIWKQKLSLDGYEKAEEDIRGYEYVGREYVSEQKITGFKEVRKDDSVTMKTISPNASENVFRHYFDREEYRVVFNPNYPDGSAGESVSLTVRYGTEVEVPSEGYTAEGYCLAGWSTSAGGEPVYKANYIDTVLYNRDGDEMPPADTFVPERNTALYAVWIKGYTDMFGGDDYIYLLEKDSDVIYLSRSQVFFKGTYNAAVKEFYFEDARGDVLLEGKLFGHDTYIYFNATRAENARTLYDPAKGLVSDTLIYFDEYNGLTYSYTPENGTPSLSKGEYVVENDVYYVASFSEGELAGETLTFIIGTVNLGGTQRAAFQLRNEEEYNLGTLVRGVVNGSSLTYYKDEVYSLTLDGFGTAYFNAVTSMISYRYTMEEGVITLRSSSSVAGILRVVDIHGVKGYMLYEEELDRVFTDASGATLQLDGVCKATYANGSRVVEGYYTTEDSYFGGKIVTFTVSGTTYAFLTTATSTSGTLDPGKEGEEQPAPVVTYTFEKKSAGYAEYYYNAADGKTYFAPLLVVNDTQEGYAALYDYTSAAKYEKISEGVYAYDASTKLYTYTAEHYFYTEKEYAAKVNAGEFAGIVDLSKIKACVFSVDTELTSYRVNYWYSMTTEEGTTPYDVRYSLGGDTLTLVAGIAIYAAEGSVVTGTYSTDASGLTTVKTPSGSLYFELNEAEKTFVKLTTAPYKAYLLKADGKGDENVYIAFDGKGGAVYTISTPGEGGDPTLETYAGTFAETDATSEFGAPVYAFTAEGKTFEFLLLSASSTRYFAPYNPDYNGSYESSDGILTLDGFGYRAEYIDADGVLVEGNYYLYDENVICLGAEDGYRYFDLSADRGFTVRGREYGAHLVMDNQALTGLYAEFDGYGGLSVYKFEENGQQEEVRVDVDTDGSYASDGELFTLTYRDGAKTVTLIGRRDTLVYNSGTYNVFVLMRKEVKQTYVNENDWSVLILDEFGNAVKYDTEGVRQSGSYTLITDNLLYFVNEDETDACIYKYDVAKATATPIIFTVRGYYTKDLDSLLFSRYGFAIFNGTTRYYYNIENGRVVIYLQDPGAPAANEYGFVVKDFGEFSDVKEYEGKTYYINSGYDLTFKRSENGRNKYPVTLAENDKKPLGDLIFRPSGSGDFSVNGVVAIDGKNYSCTVTRVVGENGEIEEMYVSISASVGSYRFDIQVAYNGENEDGSSRSTYEVTGMRRILSAPSYTYLDTYYMIYSFLGPMYASSYTNEIGTVSINYLYDENGEETESYVEGLFGEDSFMYDTQGNLLSFERAQFEVNSETGLYTVALEAADGYTYRFYFGFIVHKAFNMYGYYAVGFTRVETLTAAEGYTIEVERTIGSDDKANPAGSYFSVLLSKDGAKIPSSEIYILEDGSLRYIVREKDGDGAVVKTLYYRIVFKEKTAGSVEEKTEVMPFESADVTAENVTTVYTGDKTAFADVSGQDGVTLIVIGEESYFATESVYDEETKTYTVTTASGKIFTVKIENQTAEITEKTESGEPSAQA